MSTDPATTRLDRLWGRALGTPARLRAWEFGAPAAVVLLAAVLRFVNLGWPNSLVFDESYYVKDALAMSGLGYEATWPDGANDQVNAGVTSGYLPEPEFAVHPPLGKWIISLGFLVWGRADPFGWRFAVAVCGVLVVLLTYLIARHLFGSVVLAAIAGLLLAIDGQAIAISRTAILDGPLTLFCLAGVGAVLLDRRWLRRRWGERMPGADSGDGSAGTLSRAERMPGAHFPLPWARPWLITAAALFGLACGIKWSGVWFLLGFTFFVVFTEVRARHARASGPAERAVLPDQGTVPESAGRLAVGGALTAVSTFVVASAAYLSTWAGWFGTSGGSDRTWAQQPGNAWTGPLAWVPPIIQSFVHHHIAMYQFNVGLSIPHGYQANPLTWLLYTQPLSMYTRTTTVSGGGVGTCGASVCHETAWLMANPVIWWASVAALLVVLVRFVLRRDWRLGVILLGVAAGYLPWLLFLNRTVFQFYSIVFEPYLVLALAAVLGMILGRRTDPRGVRVFGVAAVGVFLLLCLAVSAFFYPLWVASPAVSDGFIDLHLWLTSWRWE